MKANKKKQQPLVKHWTLCQVEEKKKFGCALQRDERAPKWMLAQLLNAPWSRAVNFPLKGRRGTRKGKPGLGGDRAGAGPI